MDAISGGEVEADTIVASKRHLHRQKNMQGVEGWDHVQADGVSVTWHHGWHRHPRLKVLFLWSTVLRFMF